MPEFWAQHLTQIEKLLWTGRPERGREYGLSFFRHRLLFAIISAVCIWIIFNEPPEKIGYYKQIAAQKYATAYVSAWICLPPSALLTLFLQQYRYITQLSRYRYALTDRRAIIARASGRIVQVWYLDENRTPWREPDSVQFGTTEFQHKMYIRARGRSTGREAMSLGGFEMIKNAQQVYDLAIGSIAKIRCAPSGPLHRDNPLSFRGDQA